MNKLLNLRTAIGLACILLALGLMYKPSPNKIDNDLSILNIEKPSQDILERVGPIAKTITDPTDRAKLAIFNQEFAKRVPSYDTDLQQVNDVYVIAAASFFENSLKDKYENLDVALVDLIQQVTTDENHKLTLEEKNKVSQNFLGLSWSLIQK